MRLWPPLLSVHSVHFTAASVATTELFRSAGAERPGPPVEVDKNAIKVETAQGTFVFLLDEFLSGVFFFSA